MIKYPQLTEVESVTGYELQSLYSPDYRSSRLTQKPGFLTQILNLNPEFVSRNPVARYFLGKSQV
ncbi:hypothetical protein C7B69_25195 [filamentous cyanobacterium Phorm 46]|nr:hypothetical protein C7B69_25195 [filamentous cyanobacterium Phorm 46]PSB45291.1 hypothetical protein C7B67_21610 [filamentous cyanobacterium Phorm 6]